MAGVKKEPGPTSRRVAENVREIRGAQGLSYAELARRLRDVVGHPILDTGLMKIEKGERRVDVDDIVALALALGVNVSSLILPRFISGNEEVELSPNIRKNPWIAWNWADGRMALKGSYIDADGNISYNLDELDQFVRYGRPAGEEPFLPDAVRTLSSLVLNVRELDVAGDDREKWAPRVVNIKRLMNRLIGQVSELIKPFPIEKTGYARDAAEADAAFSKLTKDLSRSPDHGQQNSAAPEGS